MKWLKTDYFNKNLDSQGFDAVVYDLYTELSTGFVDNKLISRDDRNFPLVYEVLL